MNWKIPYFDLKLDESERQAVMEVLESNWLTSGPKIQAFEAAFANSMELRGIQAIAVSSCTAALHLGLLALGIKEGDEVILPSLTFVAAANSVKYCGATPVFADVRSGQDLNIDPEDVVRKITTRTRAIMVMHYGGYACDMDRFKSITDEYGLKLIEDACHGPLAEFRGSKLGTLGDIGCFSFFSNKNLATGEGGMVVTRSAEVGERVRILRSHGMTASTYERFKGHAYGYDVVALGYNYRLDEMRAALGLMQLKKLAANNERRRELVEYYRKRLGRAMPDLEIPFRDRAGINGYHIFAILLPHEKVRDQVMRNLGEQGIQTSFHYRPTHTFSAYQGMGIILPVTDSISGRLLSLPLYPTMQESQVDQVVEALGRCL